MQDYRDCTVFVSPGNRTIEKIVLQAWTQIFESIWRPTNGLEKTLTCKRNRKKLIKKQKNFKVFGFKES